MTLQTDCLGKTPVSGQTVQAYYDESHTSPVDTLRTRIKLLCLSHERLRAELTGLEIVAKENEAAVERLDALIKRLEASMPHMAGGNILRMEATIEELKKVRHGK